MEAQTHQSTAMTSDPSAHSSWIGEEIQAMNSLQNAVMTPPYDGGYRRLAKTVCPQESRPCANKLFDSADRQYPNRGEIVAQLWSTTNGDSAGWIESGLRRDFKATTTGLHRVLIRIEAGPITQRQGAFAFVRALIPGLKSVYGGISSHQTSFLSFNIDLQQGDWYRLFVMGGINILHRRFAPPSYGEVIATFPRITVFPIATPLQADPFDAQLQRALAEHESPTAAGAALQASLGEGVIELT